MNHTCINVSPFPLAGVFISTRLSHAVQGLLQEVFSERLSHLRERIHCNRTGGINTTNTTTVLRRGCGYSQTGFT